MIKGRHFKLSGILIILLFLQFEALAQQTVTKRYMIVRSTPSYTLQIHFDYNQSVLELSGAYNDDYQSVNVDDGESFSDDKGYGGTVTSKITLNDRGSIRFTQSLTYNRIL